MANTKLCKEYGVTGLLRIGSMACQKWTEAPLALPRLLEKTKFQNRRHESLSSEFSTLLRPDISTCLQA